MQMHVMVCFFLFSVCYEHDCRVHGSKLFGLCLLHGGGVYVRSANHSLQLKQQVYYHRIQTMRVAWLCTHTDFWLLHVELFSLRKVIVYVYLQLVKVELKKHWRNKPPVIDLWFFERLLYYIHGISTDRTQCCLDLTVDCRCCVEGLCWYFSLRCWAQLWITVHLPSRDSNSKGVRTSVQVISGVIKTNKRSKDLEVISRDTCRGLVGQLQVTLNCSQKRNFVFYRMERNKLCVMKILSLLSTLLLVKKSHSWQTDIHANLHLELSGRSTCLFLPPSTHYTAQGCKIVSWTIYLCTNSGSMWLNA